MQETKYAIATEAIQIWLHCLSFDFSTGWGSDLCCDLKCDLLLLLLFCNHREGGFTHLSVIVSHPYSHLPRKCVSKG